MNTLNTRTSGLNAQDELSRIAEVENFRKKMDKLGGEKTQRIFGETG